MAGHARGVSKSLGLTLGCACSLEEPIPVVVHIWPDCEPGGRSAGQHADTDPDRFVNTGKD